MLLALTLAALTPQTAPYDAGRSCIMDALTPAQRAELAGQFVAGEMKTAEEFARPVAAKCAATWKWTAPVRDWNIILSAAYAAMVGLESQLTGKLDNKKLKALFERLSDTDRYGLTIGGANKLDDAAYSAILRRVAALLAAEKLSQDDLETAANWFIAFAQFSEADVQLEALAKAK